MLISLFILNGCDNPSKVGLDVDPGDQIYGELIDDLKISAVTVKADSIFTKNTPQLPLGYLKDPSIGESNASIQFALQNIASGDSRIPTDATIDSAILAINYGVDRFGDTLASTTKIQVNQLASPYEIGKNYSTNTVWNVNPDVFGEKTINKFAYRDSVLIRTIIKDADTTLWAAPHIRIPLDVAKVKNLFDGNIDSTQFAEHDFYHNRIKGFQISVNKAAQTGVGSFAHLSIDPEQNGLIVYYKTPDTTKQKIKHYQISAANAAAAVSHTYTTEVQNQLDNPTGDFSTVYTQAPAGLRIKLSLPTLSSLKDQNLIVNKAELVIYTDEDLTGNSFTEQASRLTLYREDIAGQRTPIPDGDTREQIRDPRSFGLTFGGTYDKSKKRYLFTLTSYVQDLLEGKISSSVFYIEPSSNAQAGIVPYLPSVNSGMRAILGTDTNPNYKMKLNIYYSKAN